MFVSGLISGLVAQSELTQLLDELYVSPTLLEELYRSHNLSSLDEAGEKESSAELYSEVASIFG
jgi:hypothetical protein